LLQGQEVSLPDPVQTGTGLERAFNRRMSVRSFANTPVPDGHLSRILWGVDRMSGLAAWTRGRILVGMGEKIYEYRPDSLVLVRSDADLPSLRMFSAPASVYLLAEGEDNDSLWLWRGMAGQAVYLIASALEMGTVTVRGVGFPLGYPERPAEFLPVLFPADSARLPLIDKKWKDLQACLESAGTDTDASQPLNRETWSSMLWASYGYSMEQEEGRIHRTVPSARGRYPMEVCTVQDSGVFRYLPGEHHLEKLGDRDLRPMLGDACGERWMADSPGILVFFWNPEKMKSRGSALYESGAMLVNTMLTGAAFHLPVRWALIEDTDKVNRILDMDTTLIPLAAVGVAAGAGVKEEYRDGVYTGEITEWPEMKVEVVVQGGKITEIRILEDFGTPEFSKPVVEKMPPGMVARNSWDVDGVSGSTLSSNHLKNAVREALKGAKEVPVR
jgi:uncharacterized protein with FMN-binding domain